MCLHCREKSFQDLLTIVIIVLAQDMSHMIYRSSLRCLRLRLEIIVGHCLDTPSKFGRGVYSFDNLWSVLKDDTAFGQLGGMIVERPKESI